MLSVRIPSNILSTSITSVPNMLIWVKNSNSDSVLIMNQNVVLAPSIPNEHLCAGSRTNPSEIITALNPLKRFSFKA